MLMGQVKGPEAEGDEKLKGCLGREGERPGVESGTLQGGGAGEAKN